MELIIGQNLAYNTDLPLAEQPKETQDFINNVAFDYQGANAAQSLWSGDDTPGKPIRYDVLVHEINTQGGAIIRTVVDWKYNYPYGSPSAFSGTCNLRLEVNNG